MRLRLLACFALLAGCAHPTASLWLAGDLHLGRGGRAVLAPLAGALDGAGIVNLEGAVAERATDGEGVRLVNAPGALPELAAAGIRVATIANNHARDAGPGGDGGRAALARAGVACAGGSCGAATIAVGGERVVVSAHDLTGGVPPDLPRALAADRARGDLLIATFHVTGPPGYLPRPELRAAVEIAVAAGAAIVAAHGTHAVGPVERRGGAIVAWGLGNLAFDCACTDERDAIALQVTVAAHRLRACVVPIDAGLRGAPARPASDPRAIRDLLRAIGGRLDEDGCF